MGWLSSWEQGFNFKHFAMLLYFSVFMHCYFGNSQLLPGFKPYMRTKGLTFNGTVILLNIDNLRWTGRAGGFECCGRLVNPILEICNTRPSDLTTRPPLLHIFHWIREIPSSPNGGNMEEEDKQNSHSKKAKNILKLRSDTKRKKCIQYKAVD